MILFICSIAFLFSNYIIPVANLKARTLLGDIVYAKPSFDLKEGVFYNKIGGFAIKVGKKEANDSVIRDIIIYEQSNGPQDNFIIARSGIMRVSENKRFLEFNLQNGWRYQERGSAGSANTEFIRLGFKEYNKQFDLSTFQFQRSSDSINQGNWKMKNMKQLGRAIDSMEKQNQQIGQRIKKEVFFPLSFNSFMDSPWRQNKMLPAVIKSMNQVIPDSLQRMILERVNSKLSGVSVTNESLLAQFEKQGKDMRRHQIEWHRKISLSFACLVLFVIGAPLGSIIRKGGLGNSMISSIAFFMLFYFISNTGEKFAKEGEWNSILGMWLSTLVLVPIGIFLTYKAMHDSQLFNREYYYRLWRKFNAKWYKNPG